MTGWRRRLVVGLAGGGLALALAAACSASQPPEDGAVGPRGSGTAPGPAVPATAPDTVGRRDASLRSGVAQDAPGQVRPVRVTLETVAIDAVVRPVGVAPDGQMELPEDPRVFGWYRFGPAPVAGRAAGSAVIAGHLDSRRFGLGPLVRLRDVETGDTVVVRTSDGRTTSYQVVEVARFDRQGLPPEVFARTGPHRLRLLTCGGEYDAGRGGYQQNLVVTAVPAAG